MRPIFPKAGACWQAMVGSGTDLPFPVATLMGWKAPATKSPAGRRLPQAWVRRILNII